MSTFPLSMLSDKTLQLRLQSGDSVIEPRRPWLPLSRSALPAPTQQAAPAGSSMGLNDGHSTVLMFATHFPMVLLQQYISFASKLGVPVSTHACARLVHVCSALFLTSCAPVLLSVCWCVQSKDTEADLIELTSESNPPMSLRSRIVDMEERVGAIQRQEQISFVGYQNAAPGMLRSTPREDLQMMQYLQSVAALWNSSNGCAIELPSDPKVRELFRYIDVSSLERSCYLYFKVVLPLTKHWFVSEDGKSVISTCNLITGELFDSPEQHPPAAFERRYKDLHTTLLTHKPPPSKPAITYVCTKLWIACPTRRVARIVHEPHPIGKEPTQEERDAVEKNTGVVVFNTFSENKMGAPWSKAKEAADFDERNPIRVFLGMLCNGCGPIVEWLCYWIAFIYQTRTKAEIFVILSGPHGSGKGLFAQLMQAIFGEYFARLDNIDEVFRGMILLKALLVFVDEYGGPSLREASKQKMKKAITERIIQVREIWKTQQQLINNANFLGGSNQPVGQVQPGMETGDRRTVIVATGPDLQRMDHAIRMEFIPAILSMCNVLAFVKMLGNLDLSKWNRRMLLTAPTTMQHKLVGSLVMQFFLQFFKRGFLYASRLQRMVYDVRVPSSSYQEAVRYLQARFLKVDVYDHCFIPFAVDEQGYKLSTLPQRHVFWKEAMPLGLIPCNGGGGYGRNDPTVEFPSFLEGRDRVNIKMNADNMFSQTMDRIALSQYVENTWKAQNIIESADFSRDGAPITRRFPSEAEWCRLSLEARCDLIYPRTSKAVQYVSAQPTTPMSIIPMVDENESSADQQPAINAKTAAMAAMHDVPSEIPPAQSPQSPPQSMADALAEVQSEPDVGPAQPEYPPGMLHLMHAMMDTGNVSTLARAFAGVVEWFKANPTTLADPTTTAGAEELFNLEESTFNALVAECTNMMPIDVEIVALNAPPRMTKANGTVTLGTLNQMLFQGSQVDPTSVWSMLKRGGQELVINQSNQHLRLADIEAGEFVTVYMKGTGLQGSGRKKARTSAASSSSSAAASSSSSAAASSSSSAAASMDDSASSSSAAPRVQLSRACKPEQQQVVLTYADRENQTSIFTYEKGAKTLRIEVSAYAGHKAQKEIIKVDPSGSEQAFMQLFYDVQDGGGCAVYFAVPNHAEMDGDVPDDRACWLTEAILAGLIWNRPMLASYTVKGAKIMHGNSCVSINDAEDIDGHVDLRAIFAELYNKVANPNNSKKRAHSVEKAPTAAASSFSAAAASSSSATKHPRIKFISNEEAEDVEFNNEGYGETILWDDGDYGDDVKPAPLNKSFKNINEERIVECIAHLGGTVWTPSHVMRYITFTFEKGYYQFSVGGGWDPHNLILDTAVESKCKDSAITTLIRKAYRTLYPDDAPSDDEEDDEEQLNDATPSVTMFIECGAHKASAQVNLNMSVGSVRRIAFDTMRALDPDIELCDQMVVRGGSHDNIRHATQRELRDFGANGDFTLVFSHRGPGGSKSDLFSGLSSLSESGLRKLKSHYDQREEIKAAEIQSLHEEAKKKGGVVTCLDGKWYRPPRDEEDAKMLFLSYVANHKEMPDKLANIMYPDGDKVEFDGTDEERDALLKSFHRDVKLERMMARKRVLNRKKRCHRRNRARAEPGQAPRASISMAKFAELYGDKILTASFLVTERIAPNTFSPESFASSFGATMIMSAYESFRNNNYTWRPDDSVVLGLDEPAQAPGGAPIVAVAACSESDDDDSGAEDDDSPLDDGRPEGAVDAGSRVSDLKNALTVFVDELGASAQSPSTVEKMKKAISEPVIQVREIWKTQQQLSNSPSFMAASNQQQGVAMDASDRRFAVTPISYRELKQKGKSRRRK